jgi:CBS domain containing-hemolysin-like protein
MTPVASVMILAMSPFTALPLLVSGDVSRTSESSSQPYMTEDDLKIMVDTGQEEGLLEVGERRMIHRIFDLGETLAREIMVPRIDVMALDVQTPLEEALDALLRSGYSRVPVFDETVDNVLGLLYAKDLLRVWREGGTLQDLKNLLRPAYFVPEAKKVDELLAEMQSQRIHMAVVVDEYGGVAGLVTLEDLVEEIVGDYRDSFESTQPPIQTLTSGKTLVDGLTLMSDLNEHLDIHLHDPNYDTVAGFILGRLSRIPKVGDVVEEPELGIKLTVHAMDRLRVSQVMVSRLDKKPAHTS